MLSTRCKPPRARSLKSRHAKLATRRGWPRHLITLAAGVLSAASLLAAAPDGDVDNSQHSAAASCLPTGIKLSDVVESARGSSTGKPQLVSDKLDQLRATCDGENKLVDASGRPIVFYHLIGCWGYPPPDYQELLQKQRVELAELKQHNTVIEMTCNPSGARIN